MIYLTQRKFCLKKVSQQNPGMGRNSEQPSCVGLVPSTLREWGRFYATKMWQTNTCSLGATTTCMDKSMAPWAVEEIKD